jgi:transcriptional regulator GlxA family with amidase domain
MRGSLPRRSRPSRTFPPEAHRLLDGINHFRHGRISTVARELATEVLAPNALSPLAVESLALEVLAATFRRIHRMPPGGYIRKPRVRWVADQLSGTEEPISRIAFRAGFADQAHLTRVFKAETGATPGRYRRRRYASRRRPPPPDREGAGRSGFR